MPTVTHDEDESLHIAQQKLGVTMRNRKSTQNLSSHLFLLLHFVLLLNGRPVVSADPQDHVPETAQPSSSLEKRLLRIESHDDGVWREASGVTRDRRASVARSGENEREPEIPLETETKIIEKGLQVLEFLQDLESKSRSSLSEGDMGTKFDFVGGRQRGDGVNVVEMEDDKGPSDKEYEEFPFGLENQTSSKTTSWWGSEQYPEGSSQTLLVSHRYGSLQAKPLHQQAHGDQINSPPTHPTSTTTSHPLRNHLQRRRRQDEAADESICPPDRSDFIVTAMRSGYNISDHCIVHICTGDDFSRDEEQDLGFWFQKKVTYFARICYSETKDCSEGVFFMRAFPFSVEHKVLIGAPECSLSSYLQRYFHYYRIRLPSECYQFICQSSMTRFQFSNILIFYTNVTLDHVQETCLLALSDYSVGKGETLRGNNIADSDPNSCYNEEAEIVYGISTRFPIEDPCLVASVTVSVPNISDVAFLVRGSSCKLFESKDTEALAALYLESRRPVRRSYLYGCLFLKEASHRVYSDLYHLTLLDKYLLSKSWQEKHISQQMVDFFCQGNTSLISIVETNRRKHIFPVLNGVNTTWGSLHSFMEKLTKTGESSVAGTSSLSASATLPKKVPALMLSIPLEKYSHLARYFLHHRWVLWCAPPSTLVGRREPIAAALARLYFYDQDLLKACQNIFCSSRGTVLEGMNRTEEFFWHSGPLSTDDEKCLKMSQDNGGLYHENGRLILLYLNRSQTFPPLALISVKKQTDKLHRFSRLPTLFFTLLQEGKHRYIECLSRLINDQTRLPDAVVLYSVNGTKWRQCMNETKTASEGLRSWFEVFESQSLITSGISKKLSGDDMTLLSLIISSKWEFDEAILRDLVDYRFRTVVELFHFNMFVFEMSKQAMLNHPLLKKNGEGTELAFTKYITLWDAFEKQSKNFILFMHDCSVTFEGKSKMMYLIFSFLSLDGKPPEFNVCLNDTIVLTSRPLDVQQVMYYTSDHEKNSSMALQRAQAILPDWTLKHTLFLFSNRSQISECNAVPPGPRFDAALRAGECVSRAVDSVDYYFIRSLGTTINFFIVLLGDSERSGNITSATNFVRNYTGFDVNFVDRMVISGNYEPLVRTSETEGLEEPSRGVNPFDTMLVYEADLKEVIEKVETHFQVNVSSLMTDSRYVWSFRNQLQTTVNAISTSKAECITDLVEGRSMIYRERGVTFITTGFGDSTVHPCHTSFPESLSHEIDEAFLSHRGTISLFWLGCGTQNMIVFHDKALESEWFYLSASCRAKQIFLLVVSILITVVAIFGNVATLLFSLWFDHGETRDQRSVYCILQSLAIADLLIGVFPCILAVKDHLSLMLGHVTLLDLEPTSIYGDVFSRWIVDISSFQDLRFERQGYPAFCALVLSGASFVSLFMLLLLSMERYRAVRGQLFPFIPAAIAVGASWVIAIIFSILLFQLEGGFHPAGYLDPITKLTLSIQVSEPLLSSAVIHIEGLFLVIIVTSMVFLISTTIFAFLGYHLEIGNGKVRLAFHRELNDKDQSHFKIFFVFMFCYLLSCSLLAISLFGGLSRRNAVFNFFIWWLFIAGSSWRWVYIFTEESFRNNFFNWLSNLLKRSNDCLPDLTCIKDRSISNTKADSHDEVDVSLDIELMTLKGNSGGRRSAAERDFQGEIGKSVFAKNRAFDHDEVSATTLGRESVSLCRSSPVSRESQEETGRRRSFSGVFEQDRMFSETIKHDTRRTKSLQKKSCVGRKSLEEKRRMDNSIAMENEGFEKSQKFTAETQEPETWKKTTSGKGSSLIQESQEESKGSLDYKEVSTDVTGSEVSKDKPLDYKEISTDITGPEVRKDKSLDYKEIPTDVTESEVSKDKPLDYKEIPIDVTESEVSKDKPLDYKEIPTDVTESEVSKDKPLDYKEIPTDVTESEVSKDKPLDYKEIPTDVTESEVSKDKPLDYKEIPTDVTESEVSKDKPLDYKEIPTDVTESEVSKDKPLDYKEIPTDVTESEVSKDKSLDYKEIPTDVTESEVSKDKTLDYKEIPTDVTEPEVSKDKPLDYKEIPTDVTRPEVRKDKPLSRTKVTSEPEEDIRGSESTEHEVHVQ